MINISRKNLPIRSYMRRESRMSYAAKQALQTLWGDYGLELISTPYDFDQVFKRQAPRVLEIGFGDGESLFRMACDNPTIDFIGGIWRC